MSNNVFRFGDTYFLQQDGTAMGTSLAVMYATIYCALRERTLLLPKYAANIVYMKRFIDDIFCLWQDTQQHTWQDFKADLPQGNLEWTVDKPSLSQVFLDLSISITTETGKICTRTYQKPMNLHLYLPSNSAHPPKTLKGTIIGFLYRYWYQNTDVTNYTALVSELVLHFNHRGHSISKLQRIFTEASMYLETKYGNNRTFKRKKRTQAEMILQNKPDDEARETLFLHMNYHPRGINRQNLHRAYDSTLGELQLFRKQIIAFSRPRNLRDILVPSDLPSKLGFNPSNYLTIED